MCLLFNRVQLLPFMTTFIGYNIFPFPQHGISSHLPFSVFSQEESVDNFNLWGVRRRSPSNLGEGDFSSHLEDMHSADLTPSHAKKVTPPADNEWWEEEGSVSPIDDPSLGGSERSSGSRHSSSSTSLHRHSHHHPLHHLHHHHHHHQPPVVPSAASTSVSAPTPKLTLDTSTRRPASPTSISEYITCFFLVLS